MSVRPPTDLEREQLAHMIDPATQTYNREYYLRNRKLKGRKKGLSGPASVVNTDPNKPMYKKSGKKDPRTGKTLEQIQKEAKLKQAKELKGQIDRLTDRLNKLEALISKREREEASEDRKSKAKGERAAKERDKPKSAAEKAEAARENEKYRDKNQQKLKNNASKDSSSEPKKDDKPKLSGGNSVSALRSKATQVKGQIAVARQKLAAL